MVLKKGVAAVSLENVHYLPSLEVDKGPLGKFQIQKGIQVFIYCT